MGEFLHHEFLHHDQATGMPMLQRVAQVASMWVFCATSRPAL